MDGGKMSAELWKLKKQLCPQSREVTTAMLDDDDNLVTNEEDIQEMAINAYTERLRNRPMKDGLEHVKEAKEKLAYTLMEKAKNNKKHGK